MSEESTKNKGVLWMTGILVLVTYLFWPGQQESSTERADMGESRLQVRRQERKALYLHFVKGEMLPERDMVREDYFEILEGCFWVQTKLHGNLRDDKQVCAGEPSAYQGGTRISFRAITEKAALKINWQD